MPLSVGHAIYGERNRGHALLAASPGAPDADKLNGRMDLQGTAPPNIAWKPYLSGFLQDSHYVIARTAPDPSAARPGMVFSRALFIPATEVPSLGDLSGMLRKLEELGLDREKPQDLPWFGGHSVPIASRALADALLSEGGGPVVWPRQEGFEEAVAALWRNLWPAGRLALTFRLAFSPQDVMGASPSLVATPEAAASRWSNFRVVRDTAQPTSSPAADLLVGAASAEPLRRLILELEAALPRIEDVEQAVVIQDALDQNPDLADAVSALRLASRLSPDPAVGAQVKSRLMDRAAEAVAGASATDVRMARNLELDAFGTGGIFWAACRSWAAAGLWQDKKAASAARLLSEGLVTSGAVEAWREAVAGGVDDAFATNRVETARRAWPILEAEPDLLRTLLARPPGTRTLEASLVRTAPDAIDRTAGEALARQAAKLKRPELHAACCSASLPATEAIDAHMAGLQHSEASARLALRSATGEQTVSASLRHDDPILLGIAAAACAASPKLLAPARVEERGWRDLWRLAMSANPGAWNGPRRPREPADRLIDLVLDGEAVDDALLVQLAATPLADITSHHRRGEAWKILPASARPAYLQSTAEGWTAAFARNEAGEVLEPELAEAVTAHARMPRLLEILAEDVERGCVAFRLMPTLTTSDFADWLVLVLNGPPLSLTGASAIGRLVAARTWEDVARGLADAVLEHGRRDLMPAIAFCVELIGFARRYRLDLLGASAPASAKWRTLEEVATELYPHGPDDKELWSRAGGKKGDLPRSDTGAQAWRVVIAAAEKGKTDIDVPKLLRIMSQDFARNAAVTKMRGDRFFAKRS